MSKFIKAAMASTVLAASVMGASAANAATANADARANIIEDVTITNTSGTALDFGTIVADADGGSVTVSAAGARTACTGLVCVGGTDAADFTMSGINDASVNVTVPASVTLTNTAGTGGETMSAALSATAPTALSSTGTAAFSVGGVLTVGANQVNGLYEGSFEVTAVYN